jgi:hypothetical protein
MNLASRQAPDSKADRKIARKRSVNVSSASVKNKVAVKRVAVNKAVVSKADDKTGSFETTKRREVISAALL